MQEVKISKDTKSIAAKCGHSVEVHENKTRNNTPFTRKVRRESMFLTKCQDATLWKLTVCTGLRVFYNLINMALMNGWIIYKNAVNSSVSRKMLS